MSTIFDDLKANKVWTCLEKGLRKETICISQQASVQKPNYLSTCTVIISNLVNETIDQETNYLTSDRLDKQITVTMGEACTPIDCYLEILLSEMLITEKSICCIQTKNNVEIIFVLELIEITPIQYYYELTAAQMYEVALKYKGSGVKMFPKYPVFAQNYFNKAAKCLLAYAGELCGVESQLKIQMDKLLENIFTNIAACLIKQRRYEDVIEILGFVERREEDDYRQVKSIHEKAIYRKAIAHYNLKQYDNAMALLKKTDYENNSEMLGLWNNIYNDQKEENTRYSDMVKKMLLLDKK